MGKIVVVLILLGIFLEADVQKSCLGCHEKNQIPSELIYKRYLMKYSTNSSMQEAIFNYLKSPLKKESIMPPVFFLKFPMKKRMQMEDDALKMEIEAFLKQYDIRKRLTNSH
jgi:hypothetical protein